MRTRNAAELAKLIEAGGSSCRVVGDAEVLVGPDVVIDSRKASSGALFVSLPGEHVDGHEYLPQAAQAGATAAITAHEVAAAPLVQLVCESAGPNPAQQGLTALARSLHAQARASGLLTVAITGSSGKTSTKDLLAQVLARAGPTIAPVDSLNGEVGVPLTVCRITEQTRFLVAEMGSRGVGHLRYLTGIAPPDLAVVLNVGTAHVGQFGSREVIAVAKRELVEALPPEGVAVLNADDPAVLELAEYCDGEVMLFSCDPANPAVAEHRARQGRAVLARGTEVVLQGPGHEVVLTHLSAPVQSGLTTDVPQDLRPHVLAAVAAAWAAGVAPELIRAGLLHFDEPRDTETVH